MATLITLLSYAFGIVSLVCLIMVIIQIFQNGQTGLGIACAVGILICGIGVLVTFIVGWMNSSAWGIQNIMLAWTGCIIGGILLNIIAMTMGFAVIEIPVGN